jgi:hypothetical protein
MIAAYVWDYADGIEFLRRFWDEAVAPDPAAADLDEGRRFPLCQPETLKALVLGANLRDVTVGALEIPSRWKHIPQSKGLGSEWSFGVSRPTIC